jgi:hypothetical protein
MKECEFVSFVDGGVLEDLRYLQCGLKLSTGEFVHDVVHDRRSFVFRKGDVEGDGTCLACNNSDVRAVASGQTIAGLVSN